MNFPEWKLYWYLFAKKTSSPHQLFWLPPLKSVYKKKTENHQERMVANFNTHFIGVWARALVYLYKSISMLFALTISFSPRWNDYKFFHRACENMIWIFNRQNAILYEKEKPKFISKIFVQIINLKLNFQFALIHLWKELPYFLNVCRRLNVFQSFIRWHY